MAEQKNSKEESGKAESTGSGPAKPKPPRFTVCTPLPDSSTPVEVIEGLRESLEKQSFQDFEWLPVGPGVDGPAGTRLKGPGGKTGFPVHPLKSKRSERAALLNLGIKAAGGEFFLTLDPDSRPVPEALEKMLEYWEALPERERDYFISVTGLAALKNGRVCGDTFPSSPFDSTSIETGAYYGVRGRKWGFVRTEALKLFPFPLFAGERFVPDQLVLNRMGMGALTRCVNEVFLIVEGDREKDPLEYLKRRIGSPKGEALFYNEFSAMKVPMASRIRSCANYVRFSLHAGMLPDDIFREARKKIPTFFTVWPGLLMYRRDLKRIRRFAQ
jgi:hypothetical protein